MWLRAFSDGVRRAAALLWATGAAVAGFTGILAVAHSMVAYALVYALVSAALGALAAATHRGDRRAAVLTIFLLGSQVIGLAGAAWELAYGASDTAKARHLHDLGLNYRVSLAGNMAYSALASALFAWVLVRVLAIRRREAGGR